MRLETEQMAAIADHRQGGAVPNQHRTIWASDDPTVQHTLDLETVAPIPAGTLRRLLDGVPEEAEVYVSPKEGGTQRDPIVTGYRIRVTWRGGAS